MATNYHDSGTHSLTHLAALNAIARQAGDGDIGSAEAVERLRLLEKGLRACVIHNVPITFITEADRAAAIGAPPEEETE